MYGLTSSMPSQSGKLIRKPWTIATSMMELNLLCRKCTHKPSEHAPCAGSDTKGTEGYTEELVVNLHAGQSSDGAMHGELVELSLSARAFASKVLTVALP